MFLSCDKDDKEPLQSPLTYDKGVVINGVKWASRNVDEVGTFALKHESAGKFYQWNRKKAWATIGDISDWSRTIPENTEWTKENDPSPLGWRVPTFDEIKTLFNTDKVLHEWTTQNGVNGRKFTDKVTGNSIFLPAIGYRRDNGNLEGVNTESYYWSNTAQHESFGSILPGYFSNGGDWYDVYRSFGFNIRAVADSLAY